jgi:hypothetical protein
MSKRQHVFLVLLIFICYVLFVWQHLYTNKAILPKDFIQLYYAIGLVLFLAACFFNYLFEKLNGSNRFATVTYVLLFITGAPFLYKVVLYVML